jgi:hypothetical protein
MDGVGIVCLDQKGHGVLQWLVLRSKKAGSDPFLKWSKLEMRDEKWGLSRFIFMAGKRIGSFVNIVRRPAKINRVRPVLSSVKFEIDAEETGLSQSV